MVRYRPFRNTDPPHLVEIWNESLQNRGAVRLRNSTPFERYILAKPFFDPAGLIVAEQDGSRLGFVHAGFGGNAEGTGLNREVGVTCLLAVRPNFRCQGIGTELLRRGEGYLRERGAKQLFAGEHFPNNPFYLGLYGGGDTSGFLTSDITAAPFFQKHGYREVQAFCVLQRVLDHTLKIVSPKFANHRHRFEVHACFPKHLQGWLRECQVGFVEPLEIFLEDREQNNVAARALVWEMEGYSSRWGRPAVGLMGFWVRPDLRRQGIGKFLLSHTLRQVQDQYFELAEVHIASDNLPALQFLQSLAFQQVDTSQVFLLPQSA